MTPGWDIVESTDISSHFGGVTFFLQKVSLSGNTSWGCGNPYLCFEWHFPTFFCTFDSYVKRFDHIAGTSLYPDNEFRKKKGKSTHRWCPRNIPPISGFFSEKYWIWWSWTYQLGTWLSLWWCVWCKQSVDFVFRQSRVTELVKTLTPNAEALCYSLFKNASQQDDHAALATVPG